MVAVLLCQFGNTGRGNRKKKKKMCLCDITPDMPHGFKLPIILLSRARRFERI